MQKKLYLSLLVHSTSTKKPIYKIKVNNIDVTNLPRVEMITANEELHHYALDTIDTITTFSISFINKQPNDTKVDANGVILEDLYMIIETLKIDFFDLVDKIDKIGLYKDINGNVWKTHRYMSFPGTFTFKIHKNILYTDWLASFL